MILHQPVLTAHELCFAHIGMVYYLVTVTHLRSVNTSTIQSLILTMFVILELLDLLALLLYLIHLIYTPGPQRFAFLREGPCVCVHCY